MQTITRTNRYRTNIHIHAQDEQGNLSQAGRRDKTQRVLLLLYCRLKIKKKEGRKEESAGLGA